MSLLAAVTTGTASAGAEDDGSAQRTPPGNSGESASFGNRALAGTDVESLRETVAVDGSARVIVEFDLVTAPESELSAPQVATQRDEIADLVEEAVVDLGSDAEFVGSLERIPAVAFVVGPESLERLLASPDVAAVHLDVPVPPALDNSEPVIEKDVVHEAGFDGDGFAVAILDTGVDSSHPIFGDRVVAEACFSNLGGIGTGQSLCPGEAGSATGPGTGTDCPQSISGCGHGTHVAGIAAGGPVTVPEGSPYAGTSIVGVAPKADVIAVQVFTRFPAANCGPGAVSACVLSYTWDQLKALEHVLALSETMDIAAINMSLGGGQYTEDCNVGLAMQLLIADLRASGVATAIATGNNGWTGAISSPACTPGAVAVGSSYAIGQPTYASSFSNTDSTMTDLYAPGSGILSSLPGGSYTRYNGTSMATPQVAGSFAVLREAFPSASVDQIVAALKKTGHAVSQRFDYSGPNPYTAPTYLESLGFSLPEIRLQQARLELGGTAWKIIHGGSGHGTVATDDDSISCVRSCWASTAGAGALTLTATAAPGSTFTGWSGGGCSGSGTCTVTPSTATEVTATFGGPTNDDFAGSAVITPGPDVVELLLDTSSSTVEAGEPTNCGGAYGDTQSTTSVWFTYVAPVSGSVTIHTKSSNYDTILKLYTGSSLAALTELGCNDGTSGLLYTDSSLTFSAVSGTTYRISVGGWFGSKGMLKLTVDGPATPSKPSRPTATASGDGVVSVDGVAPAGNGHSIIGYEARCEAPGKVTATASATGASVSVDGLEAEVTYSCSLRAESAVGWSPWSPSRSVTAEGVPATPSLPSASATVAAISVTGTAPAARGSAITQYQVSCSSAGVATLTASGASPSLSVGGMSRGRTYACKIRALNSHGWSDWSATRSVTTPNTPSTPAAPRLAASKASARVTVTAPAANGATITAYQISCKRSGAAARVVTVAATSVVVTKLTSKKRYACTVRAQNGLGWSAWSRAANVTPR